MTDIHEIERKLQALAPLAPSAQLRQRCLYPAKVSAPAATWHWLRQAAALVVCALVLWNMYENHQLHTLLGQQNSESLPLLSRDIQHLRAPDNLCYPVLAYSPAPTENIWSRQQQ